MAVGTVRCAPPCALIGRLPDPVASRGGFQQEMRSPRKVVAHFLNGQILKGFALDSRPSQRAFLLKPRDAVDLAATIRVRQAELKALFFVKDFGGDPTYPEFADAAQPSLLGLQVSLQFRDGEVLRGTSPSGDLGGAAFFLIPMGPRCSNRRVYVMATKAVECHLEKDEKP